MPAASNSWKIGGVMPEPAGGVFRVGHDQVDRLFPPQSRHGLGADLPARFADDVADEEKTHGTNLGLWFWALGREVLSY